MLSPLGNTCREPKTSPVSYHQPSCCPPLAPHAGNPRHQQSCYISNHRAIALLATRAGSPGHHQSCRISNHRDIPLWQHIPGSQDITSLVISASIVLSPLGNTCREPKTSPALSDQQPSCYSPLAINMTRAQDTQSGEQPSCYFPFSNQHAGSARHHQSCHISISCAISPWQHMPGAQDITSLVRAETIVLLSLGNHCAIMSC